jgi:hypothetical protein
MIRSLLARLIPFIFLGVMIVLFVVGIILFSYLLIFGAIVGMILFFITWIKEKLFPSRNIQSYQKSEKSGRTFEHDKK